jgi:hypothetical protein
MYKMSGAISVSSAEFASHLDVPKVRNEREYRGGGGERKDQHVLSLHSGDIVPL